MAADREEPTEASEGSAGAGGSRLTLDIWHPNCWTLQVTAAVPGGLLGHGVHHVEGKAQGRFTAYADSTAELETLVETIADSDLVDDVWGVDEPHQLADDRLAPGAAAQGIVVRYAIENSINDALVSRGFIPDEPVRMYRGREYWTVVVDKDRDAVTRALDEVREEMRADVEVEHIATLEDGVGSGIFRSDGLSERQREVFELARKRGYYTWPREVSASELADDLGLSKATVLEHLRKAEAKLLDPE
ncbi:helix-turn-helix domain-containing protein [Halobium salinum]|uniref:Helix-turn-helix domain-containing protein n=1 Tax=Halobium salinum TaxID=1364940 RepID=A0ABD5PA56_9EURY|nr:helix-turn-helix domain-containing protein [Halobium salinum]